LDAHRITGAGLDSSSARPTDSHLTVLAQKSARRGTRNPQPDVVIPIIGIVVVAVSGTAFIRIVVPAAAAFSGLPRLYYGLV
jgi:tellurite resistance protein TehA-like permease